MSCIQNEIILENLCDEALEELPKQGFDKLFNQENLEIIAGNLAKEQFEALAQ